MRLRTRCIESRDGCGGNGGILPEPDIRPSIGETAVACSSDASRAGSGISITTSDVESLLTHHGYLAICLLALLESCVPFVPSEITFGFAGVLAHEGHFALAGVILLGTLFELIGSCFSYGLGRLGGRPLVEKLGRKILITPKDLDRAESFLDGRGELAVVLGRALPFLRYFVSVVAGIAEMSIARFVICSAIGTAIYATAVSSVGYGLASSWQRIEHGFSLAGYAMAVVVVGVILAGVVHRLRSLRAEERSSGAR
jgi:membrane protein DedA with SNARE-associated domain